MESIHPTMTESNIKNRSGQSITKQETRLTETQKHTLIRYCEKYSEANLAIIKLNGKVPFSRNWQNAKPLSPEEAKKIATTWLETPDYPNFGVALPHDLMVVDVDPRNFKRGIDSLQQLSEDCKIDITNRCQFKILTGGGGFHLYFKLPAPYKGKIPLHLKSYAGIEFKSHGGQVVIAGSIHPETDKIYEETLDSLGATHIGFAPQSLLELLESNFTQNIQENSEGKSHGNQSYQGRAEFKNSSIDIRKCQQHLSNFPPSIEGQQGDATLFKAACLGKDYGLSPKTFYPLLVEYNLNSQPQWSEEELKIKMLNAYGYGKKEAGEKSIKKDFEALLSEEDRPRAKKQPSEKSVQLESQNDEIEENQGWIGDLDRNKAKKVTANYKNAILLLENMAVFKRSLAINTFNNKLVYRHPLVWHQEYAIGIKDFPKNGKPVDDDEIFMIKRYILDNQEIDFQRNILQEAIRSVALYNQFHPVKEYLNALKWDGVKRIGTWLIDYMGVEDNLYTRSVGKKFLLAAVTRIFEPGHKFDTMLVLEGQIQGEGKSTSLNALSQGWFIDNISDFTNKDTLLACHNGVWIAECSELDFMSKTEITAQKAFNSRQIDSFRAPYDRFVKEYPRQFVMVGTTNQFQYLRDETGNRRYWSVRTHKINQPKLKADSDQLWAEAVQLYRARTDVVYMTEKEEIDLERKAQDKRVQIDSWEEVIGDWLNNEPTDSDVEKKIWHAGNYTYSILWEHALGRNPGNFPRQEQNRIGAIMRKLGYEYKQYRVGGGQRERGFVKC
ncbi:MAG: VapE domain-containing protein [Flavobacterium sp.]